MIQTGFYSLTAVAVLMLTLLLKNSATPRRTTVRYVALCAVWFTYLFTLDSLEALHDFGMPPRIPLLVVIPIIVAIVFITGRKSFASVLEKTPLHVPILLQSFRIMVEFLIYGASLEGVFPEIATFKGLNFDILVGSSAVIVGFLAWRNTLRPGLLLVWNIASLGVLSLTVYSFISTYYFTDYLMVNGGNKSFIEFPYLLLAAVLLPVAIFLHVFSIRQVKAVLGKKKVSV